MSITDTHPLSPTGPISLEALNAKAVCGTKGDCPEPSESTRTVAISSIMPRLRAAMDLLERPCGHATTPSLKIMEMLSGNISLLQESFMHTFYAKLQQLGVDASIKLSLRLNDDVRLVVAGEHPDKQVINELLSNDSELVESFAEIAAQSAALRDLRSLRALTMHDRASSAYSALAASSGECLYQLSLKGEMSHFYFTR